MTDIIDRLKAEVIKRDRSAALISNTTNPRHDNDEGRCAQLLEDATGEIVALRARVSELAMELLVKYGQEIDSNAP